MITALLLTGLLCVCGGLYWMWPPIGVVALGVLLVGSALDLESKRKKADDDSKKENYVTR